MQCHHSPPPVQSVPPITVWYRIPPEWRLVHVVERGFQYGKGGPIHVNVPTLGTSTFLLYYYYSKRLKPTCTCNFFWNDTVPVLYPDIHPHPHSIDPIPT